MKNKTKALLAAVAVATFITAGPVSAASAKNHVQDVGGGTWQWGDESGRAYSNYYHGSKTHSATVCDGSYTNSCMQVVQIKGVWAYAHKPDLFMNVEKAYWNTY